MNFAEPSFANLFRRSRYARDDENRGEPSKKTRKEEFAVAAVAFLIKHDVPFKKFFIEQLCEENMQRFDGSIKVQPHDCADLALVSKDESKAIIVEFKIDSGLADRQNPDKPLFVSDYGYGGQFFKEFARIRDFSYVVIRQHDKENATFSDCDVTVSEKKIPCRNRNWADMAKMEKPSVLVSDLFKSLGYLNVSGMKALKLEGAFRPNKDAAFIIEIVKEAKTEVGKSKDYKFDSESDEKEFWIGMKILRNTEAFKKVSQIVRPDADNDAIGWFGYDGKLDETAKPSIWLYSSKEGKDKTCKMLKDIGFESPEFRGGGWRVVKNSVGDDLEWFRKILKKLSNY